jgi:argininosuccinate lyase
MAIKKIANLDHKGENLVSSNDNLSSSLSKIEGFSNPLWGGHFARGVNDLAQKINSTIQFDKRLYAVAIESVKAQLRMHAKRSIVNGADADALITTLDKIKKEIIDGKFSFNDSAKDIYQVLEAKVKEVAPKLSDTFNTARSEGNQLAGDLRLWTRDAYTSLDAALQNLQAALIDKSEENVKAIFPGNTHSQLTQPASLGQHLMAYVNMFGRERAKISDARDRMNESPYASGEIAGSSFDLNREMVSRILSFNKACNNSVDAICSRDFAVEFLSIAASTAVALSRLAEELVRWHSSESDYIEFSNAFITQSNVVPYKRDPEALEMIRAKSGRVFGSLVSVLTITKALPLEYSNDYREITEPVVDSYDTILNCANTMAAIVADFTTNRKKMKEAASHSFSTALDLVEWLVQNAGSNLSKAQTTSRKIIEYAIDKGKKLSLLEIAELQKIEPKITDDIYSVLIPSRAMIARRSGNGSNPVQIRKAIRAARRKFI